MGLKDLPHVHTRGNAQRVEADFNGGAVRQERHVFFGHDLGDHTLVTVASGHLVTDLELLLGGDVDLHLLDRAVTGAFSGLDGTDLALTVALELVKLGLVRADDLHDLDANRRGVDLDVLGDRGQLAQEGLRDLAVGGDDDLAGFAVDDVERDLLAKEDVGQGLGESLAQLVHLRLVLFLDLLDLATAVGRGQLLLLVVDAGGNLHVHDDAGDAGGDDQGGVLNIRGLLAEDRAKELFLRGKLRLGLRGDLADEDVAGLHLGTDANDAVVVEVLQGFLTHVRDVARDFFGPELGVAGGDLELLDVDRGEDVFLQHLLGDQDRVLEVVAVPGHESHEDVAAQRHLALVGRGAVGDDVAGLDLLAVLHDRLLVEAGVIVRAHELAQLVHVDVVLRVGLEGAGHLAVLCDDDTLGIHGGDDAGLVGDHDDLGVACDALLDARAHEGSLGLQEGDALALHVGAHERAVGVVMLEEGDHSGGDRDHLLGRNVHVVDLGGGNLEELAVLTDGDLAYEEALLVDLGIGLGDYLGLLLVSGEVLDLVGGAAFLDDAVGRLDEAELVHAGVGRQGIDEADVRTLGGLDRADAAVVRGMHVTDFEARTLAVQASRPEGGEAALVRHLRERVDLVHELGELASGEEVADDGRQRLRVDQLLRGDRVDTLVVHRHALADKTLRAGEAHAALVGEKFADRADATAAQVIDVVNHALSALEADKVLGCRAHVTALEDALLQVDLEAELLVDLVAAHAAEVVALRIEEQALEKGLGVGRGRGFARTQALVDFLQGLLLVAGGVLLEGADDGALVDRGVDDADRGDLVLLEGADDLLGQRLERAGEDDALLGVDCVLDENEGRHVLHVEGLRDLEVLDFVEEIEDVDVAGVPDGAKQRRDEELAATAAAVEVDVEQVVVVELNLEPGTAVGNDAERMEELAVRVRGHLEGDAGGAVELGDDDALGAVDDERAALGHHRDLAHVDVLVLDEVFLTQPQLDVEGDGVGDALSDALDLRVLGVAQVVGDVLERQALVVRLDGEDLLEDGFQALGLALLLRHALLQEFQIRGDLDLDEVRRLNDFAKFAEVNAFG